MNTLILFLVTLIAWFALEFWRVLHHEASISDQIRMLDKSWHALAMLAGLVVGLLMGHWFFQ